MSTSKASSSSWCSSSSVGHPGELDAHQHDLLAKRAVDQCGGYVRHASSHSTFATNCTGPLERGARRRPSVTRSAPPGLSTVTSVPLRPRGDRPPRSRPNRCRTPASSRRRVRSRGSRRGPRRSTLTNSTFAPPSLVESSSRPAPRASTSFHFGSSRTTTWGLPTYATPERARERRRRRSPRPWRRCRSRRRRPSSRVTVRVPASVSTSSVSQVARRGAAHRGGEAANAVARHLGDRSVGVVEDHRDGRAQRREQQTVGAHARRAVARPRARAAAFHHGAVPCSITSTRKSLPAPCHFCRDRSAIVV